MKVLNSDEELTTSLNGSNAKKAVIFFCACWHAPSMQMAEAWEELIALNRGKGIEFLAVEAEAAPNACKRYGVTSVPTFALKCEGNQEIVEGANIELLSNKVRVLAETEIRKLLIGAIDATVDQAAGIKHVKELLKEADTVMLFMKGSPSAPYCRFSRKAIELLQAEGIQFSSFDVLKDEEVRQGIKTYSDFPTFPQLYVKGELVGGVDILQDMVDTAKSEGGTLKNALGLSSDCAMNMEEKAKQATTNNDDLDKFCKELVSSHRVMLFMKGDRDEPHCGFSRRIVALLRSQNVTFSTFDVLKNEGVRHRLKTLSEWPTYPQLYVDSELVGGVDIVQDLIDSDEFQSILNDQ